MNYIERSMENTLRKAAKMFSVILITGARQVGKTTLLRHMAKDIPYLTLDDPLLLHSAVEEAGSFFKATQPPVIVDEIQYAPNLFPYIKMIVDESKKKGQFYLAGSQQFRMMKNVSESLAGRIGLLNLPGLSLREIKSDQFNEAFIPTAEYFDKRKAACESLKYMEIWDIIHKGSMPAMHAEDMDWQMFYAAYTKTYLERDVRELTKVGDELKFLKFMTAIAARTSQMLNLSSIASEVGVSVPTADRWLSILISSNIVYLLQPYYNNITKRAIKTPKLYFLDTGLAAYLTKWNTPEVLEAGAMAGAFFETFVVAEILKSYYNAGILEPALYYYRNKDRREIDIIIEQNGMLYPVEIKKTANPSKEHITSFSALNRINGIKVGTGGVVCMYDKCVHIDKSNVTIPIMYL
ncbi:ATP-binding protein [Lutispora saccharofermentans]|uniref:ATP-binding protein n=1 Tax=Lutispora saccharofermentans TaxID=3024236 RepID=A0ABT1NK06_9FIRM|nr:ATP-binding protein [Lutispora saccharofermentans]MCQ1531587.1 ATP-binding protein [Lutispora saccharofermentans]